MRCMFSLVGHIEQTDNIIMELDVIPRKNESFAWPGIEQTENYVRHVGWYVASNEEGETPNLPFVYIVIGPTPVPN